MFNYPALFITFSTAGLLSALKFTPSVIFTVLFAVVLPIALTIYAFNHFESHDSKDKLTLNELDVLKEDPDFPFYASILQLNNATI